MKVIRIIVTGGSGFIGTNLVGLFIENGYEVLNVDIVKPKVGNHIKFWVNIDITDINRISKCFLDFNPDYIVHLAARTDLDGATLDDYNANIVGVQNLMKVANELPNLKKILITSSMLVCSAGYIPKNQFDYSPTTIYGQSKVETENIVWANKPLCDWAILRPTSIWGPWFGIPYKNFFDLVISKKYFHIGNKGCTKTYGYVGNSIYQIESILFSETKDEKKKVFYIGDNPPINIEQWGNEIANEIGYKVFKMPYLFVKLIALFGDSLKLIGVNFPMNSFRLKNMTTNNIVDLKNTYDIAPNPPYNRVEGVKKTLNWIKEN